MLVLCVPLEIVGHELFKRKDHMAEKGVRQAPGERLLRAVHHDDEIREPRERGIGALGERHDLVAVLAGVAHVVDLHVVGTGDALRSAVVCFYLSNEGVSMLENAAHLGLPVPDKLKGILAQLHGRMDEQQEGDQ